MNKPTWKQRIDGWVNILSGVGTQADPRSASRFVAPLRMGEPELRGFYNGNGIAKRIVNVIPDMVTMKSWKITGDTDNEVWTYFKKLDAQQMIRRALRWSRAFGGSVILVGVDDGRPYDAPVNMNAIKRIGFLRVFDRYCVNGTMQDYDTDPYSDRFGQRKFYNITPRGRAFSAATIRVHYSRIIPLDGVDVPELTRNENDGWGDSVLQTLFEELRRYSEALDSSEVILRDFIQGVLKIKNLSDLVGSEDGDKLVQARLNSLDLTRSTLNTILIDDGEEYTKVTSTVTGIPEVVAKFEAAVAACAELPQTVVFGASPQGMNATGASDIRNFYDVCGTYREEKVTPIVERLTELMLAAKDSKIKTLESTAPIYQPLWQETDKERADTRKVVAETDKIYIDSGVVDPVEVANSRYGGDEYSSETVLMAPREMLAPVITDEDIAAKNTPPAVDADGNPIPPPKPGEEPPPKPGAKKAEEKDDALSLDERLLGVLEKALDKAA